MKHLIIRTVFKVVLSYIPAWIASLVLIPLATFERGYSGAYGSEWLLLILIFATTYWFLTNHTQKLISKERRRKNERAREARYEP